MGAAGLGGVTQPPCVVLVCFDVGLRDVGGFRYGYLLFQFLPMPISVSLIVFDAEVYVFI